MRVTVIGLDGGPLDPEARRRLDAATLVVGGARNIAAASLPEEAETLVLGPLEPALDALAAHEGDPVVLASGDPGFFGIVRALRERGHALEVFAARSSVALAFARSGMSWDDALVVSAHGRDLRRAVNACRAHPKVAVLTAPGAGPAELGRELHPQTPRAFVVCENLGGPEERVMRVRPAEATTRPWKDPNVVIVYDPRRPVGPSGWIAGARPGPDGWALPESEFEYRAGQITKAEVRAHILARLGPRVGDLVWDIGAGSGSVGIECARLGAAVVAVERDEESCARIRRNVQRHGVKVAVSRGAAPDVLDHLPIPDAIFVGGGGLKTIEACAPRALRAMVVSLAAVERVGPTLDLLKAEGYAAEAVQLSASRFAALPDGTHRLQPNNPVFVVSGVR
ncbi:precorrin-6y C5,15-methyltransferase (decarboxylating) subunit CbiE [Actinocorallia sp. A-T 12471]|uniref:precorrin-6y C5,15-methyltransferase (decarboxylating) subunit CbiE n=1 Tax=Actinocorallia sp. A-T 12471 TaxID=3089813 RepID=UPI0029CFF451|nr:precorrin-6y C5,15-methyltransferase (decarboxylating) subunit CbiE [Actinocorallia sp. A-T 12471]MDX6742879.1 precorrin-6y C5,15-methyltransferase (decarboxylating) subunit CbiE [Actinocorallia sp. A-T 12471]